jgi:hypothetical protein
VLKRVIKSEKEAKDKSFTYMRKKNDKLELEKKNLAAKERILQRKVQMLEECLATKRSDSQSGDAPLLDSYNSAAIVENTSGVMYKQIDMENGFFTNK